MPRPTKPAALPQGLQIWTIYDHPKDMPDKFVARLWEGVTPTDQTIVADDLDTIRRRLRNKGYTRLPRQEADDAKIVETWL